MEVLIFQLYLFSLQYTIDSTVYCKLKEWLIYRTSSSGFHLNGVYEDTCF